MRMVLNQVLGPVLGRPLLLKNWAYRPTHLTSTISAPIWMESHIKIGWNNLKPTFFFPSPHHPPTPLRCKLRKAPQVARSIVPDPYLEFFTTGPHKFDKMLVSTPEQTWVDWCVPRRIWCATKKTHTSFSRKDSAPLRKVNACRDMKCIKYVKYNSIQNILNIYIYINCVA